jgi:protein archease
MSPTRFRLVGHTGDLAVRLWGSDPADLLRSAGAALSYLLAGDSPIEPHERRRVEVEGADLEEVLVGWMNRLLLLHQIEDLLLCRFEPEAPRQGGVGGWVWGETFDPRHHSHGREIKAVTYHGLHISRAGRWWTARVVMDL